MSKSNHKTAKDSISFNIEDSHIDRQVLPIQEAAGLMESARDEIEQQLTIIWAKLLEIKSIASGASEAIGIQDDFFELGGDSMVAVQLFDEIEEIWGQNLPLATLFENKTIKQLATVLRQKEWVSPWFSLVCIQTGEEQQLSLFCIHPVGGHVLEYHTLANYLDKKQTVYGLQSQGLDGKSAPLQRVEDMAEHYIEELRTLLTTVQPTGIAGF
jgi:acyl carrier protein